ncbi:MAG: accessory factor UbiK family protein [Proteobacteria bacterium]|nr:accessory factor UbiK family protein [Pseudomonadota bacterium]
MNMGPDNPILDDIARVAGGALNIVGAMQGQIREEIKSRVDEIAVKMDLVPREELDEAKTIIAALRKRLETVEKRLDALEKSGGRKEPVKKTLKAGKKA